MFSTLSGGRRYPGSISHRHKHVTFGKIAIGVAKGTAMIVIGVPVCTIAAGIGATAIVAYGLASPFYYGGKKLVKKIRRQVRKKEELECTDRLTREDILVWLENCEGEPESTIQCDDASAIESLLVSGDLKLADAASGLSASHGASSSSGVGAGIGQQRKKPALRRLFSRENRAGFLLLASSPPDAGVGDRATKEDRACGGDGDAGASGCSYRPLVNEVDESETDGADQEELWREMEHVIQRLRQDRLSICPENVVTVDRPLILENGNDVMQFIQRLQLDGHLRQLTRASSMPSLSQWQTGHSTPEEDLLSSLPQDTLTVQKKRYLRAVSDNGVLPCRRQASGAAATAASEPVS